MNSVQELAVGSSLPCAIDDCAYPLLDHEHIYVVSKGRHAIATTG